MPGAGGGKVAPQQQPSFSHRGGFGERSAVSLNASSKMAGAHAGAGGAAKSKKHHHAAKGYPSMRSSRLMRSQSMIDPSPNQARVIRFIDQKAVTALMTVITVYALFGDDVRLAAAPPAADDVFWGLSSVALFLFLMELLLNCYAKHDYLFRFYFWLDLAATLSLIPDIGWLWNALVGDDATTGSSGAIRAGRASRAGTRAGRIVRIVRLVRLVRIVKLYKHVQNRKHEEEEDDPINADQPSQVGKRLSDLTTIRVISVVLIMLIAVPVFDANYVSPTDGNPDIQSNGIEMLHSMSFMGVTDSALFYKQVVGYVQSAGVLLLLSIHNVSAPTMDTWLRDMTFVTDEGTSTKETPLWGWTYDHLESQATIDTDFRTAEALVAEVSGCFNPETGVIVSNADTQCESRAIFDASATTQLEAGLNIAKTVFVMVVLAASSFAFTKDAENIVIQPIERMVLMVKQLAKNPLATVQHRHRKGASGYETQLLEVTLAKVGALLQVGFGEAGANIIGSNMSSTGAVNPLVKGRKMQGIFGFCDIRQFTDATECLQEHVMVFVNRIADIVHKATHEFLGAANKNIGDAFLLVWRMPDEDTPGRPSRLSSVGEKKADPEDDMEENELMEEVTHEQMADNSLFSFLKVMVDIENSNRTGDLNEYALHPKIRERFPDGYSVKMGYGLHLGWAIEGAIGSRFKIDASYLSPNVNMASRLEAATKQYGTPLLISHSLWEVLSPAAREYLRCIDNVTVKGSTKPMKLYTFDVTNIIPELGTDESLEGVDYVALANFAEDPNVKALQVGLDPKFLPQFAKAVDLYFAGDWAACKVELDAANALKPDDGPTATLLRVLAGHDNVKPSWWKGFRPLTEK